MVSRQYLSFRAINRRGGPGYDPGLQRHHLLPRQLLACTSLSRMFVAIGGGHRLFDDFRANGLLLPCNEAAAMRLLLPLHRGPHRHYRGLVLERVGRIEAGWARLRWREADSAALQALMRLNLLQSALRRFLLDSRKRRPVLNRRDPWSSAADFSDLDAMAEALWSETGE